MNKNIFLIVIVLIFSQTAFADQTQSYYFTGTCPTSKSVAINGGNIRANINTDTGALSAAFNPGFLLTTNSGEDKELTMSANCLVQGGSTPNAIFNITTAKYIILTNNTVLPPASSVTNIKGTPIPASNPNAIAYGINNPATATGLTVQYDSTNKNWQLVLRHSGQTPTSITIPAAAPLTNTYSFDDEPGDYKATITLSFDD